MKIRDRLVLLVFLLILPLVGAVSFALRELDRVSRDIQQITQADIPLSDAVSQIATLQLRQALTFQQALRFATQAAHTDASYGIPLSEAEKEFQHISSRVQEQFANLEALLRGRRQTEKGRDPLGPVATELNQLRSLVGRYEAEASAIFQFLRDGDLKEANLRALTIAAQESELRTAVAKLLDRIGDVIRDSSEQAREVTKQAFRGVLLLSIGAIALGVLAAILIARTIVGPVHVASRFVNEITARRKDAVTSLASQESSFSLEAFKGFGNTPELQQLLDALVQMRQAVRSSERALKLRASELARSNAELEQFAYVASHDLQEPLRMVASYLQLLSQRYKGKLDSSADEFIDFAVDGAARMKSLINDLLVYSRVGRAELTMREVRCAEVLERVRQNLTVAIEESGAVLTTTDLPIVRVDETRLIQLFQNLISNAIKFRGADPPQISISAERVGREWIFKVQDNGIGIEKQSQERIFQIFQRLHTATQYPGTGIGLAICKKIVERLEGRIWVESEPGSGSTFLFAIPAW